MPGLRTASIPMEILAKGSISDLLKNTRNSTVKRKPPGDKPLWLEFKDEVFNNITIPVEVHTKTEKPSPDEIKDNLLTENKVDKKILTKDSQYIPKLLQNNNTILLGTNPKRNNQTTTFLYQLKKSYYKRMLVNTSFSISFDGILTRVNDDFIVLITTQLSIVSIPLLCIVSFYIRNP